MSNRIVFALQALLLFLLPTETRAENIFFNHIRGEHGLSHPTVYSIYQDEMGMIWIGTRYGLNRYDGNKVTLVNELVDARTGALYRNDIKAVCGDGKGKLYIQSGFTLLTFDAQRLKTDKIYPQRIVAVSYDNGNLWACSDSQVYKLAPTADSLLPHFTVPAPYRITCVHEMKNGSLLCLGTKSDGILFLDRNKKFTRLLPGVSIISLYEDSKQNIWAATLQHGVYVIAKNGSVTGFRHDSTNRNSLPDDFTRAVCEDETGNIWIGTFSGLCRYNPAQGRFETFTHAEEKPYSIGSSSIWSIAKDNNGTIWIGSYYGGVDYFNPDHSIFRFYGVNNGPGQNLSSPVVGRIIQDKHNQLWIGTEGGGVNRLDRTTGEIVNYIDFKDSRAIHAKNIKSFHYDPEKDILWIGAVMDGLIRLDLKTQTSTVFKRRPRDSTSLRNNYILDIEAHDGKLYLATNNSVVVFDTESLKSSFLVDNAIYGLEDKQVRNLLIDSKQRLWFSANNGVFRYDLKTGKMACYRYDARNPHSVGPIYHSSFLEDAQGRIWIGTAGTGLALYNETTDDFTIYNSQNSEIIDDYIVDLNQTESGYLIIATNSGLSFFDSTNELFINLHNQTIFPISSINDGGLCVTTDGEIYVGSTTGLFSFHDNIINTQPQKADLIFTDFFINNVRIRPGADSPLRKIITYCDHIELPYNQNSLSFEYIYTNYIDKAKHDIEYRLEGFDASWIKANNSNRITYTNLSPGEYTLKIRLVHKGQTLGERDLWIRIKPPFYATWYAYLFYGLVTLSVVLVILRFYTSNVRFKMSLDYERREREQITELNQSKLRFFTNISHEFRTPLTLIINQADSLLQSLSLQSPIYTKLLSIDKNAQRMRRLINELLDFRKQEQGHMHLKVARQDLLELIREIYLTFSEFARSRGIDFSMQSPLSRLDAWFDAAQMEKVIYNLLSNAFKFTPDGGSIVLGVESREGWAIIEIADSGIGIRPDDLAKIFDCFYQSRDSEKSPNYSKSCGTGIGLTLAKGIVELHHGTISVANRAEGGTLFTVRLPLDEAYFRDDEKCCAEEAAQARREQMIEPDKEFIHEAIESMQSEAGGGKYTILLVEDNEELLEYMRQVFSQIYRVITANNGVDGLEKAQKYTPDVIVSDVMMPGMDGIEMCGKIKSYVETSHIPVILLTTRTAIEYTIEGYRIGADDYLTKPFDIKLLITRCNNLINNRRLLQLKFSQQRDADVRALATNNTDVAFMERMMEVIDRHIDNPTFDVELFSKEMMMGRTAFFQKVKGITGQTPNEFVTCVRLKRSLQVLTESPELSVSEICYKLGFTSPSYFTKRFKDFFGVTPVMYRKKEQK